MNVLLVSSTFSEIEPLYKHLQSSWIESPLGVFTKGSCTATCLITGVGMHRMSYALGRYVALQRPDLCINAGVAGGFNGKVAIGDVVHVTSEAIVDLGAEDIDGDVLVLEQIGLEEDISSIKGLVNTAAEQYAFLKNVRGITSNTGHGSEASVAKIVARWDPDVESMEGGAFFYCCLKADIPFVEIRAISNMIEPRNRNNWDMDLAINNLNAQLIEMLNFFVA